MSLPHLDHFAAVEIIRGQEKTDSSVPGTVLTLLVRRQALSAMTSAARPPERDDSLRQCYEFRTDAR